MRATLSLVRREFSAYFLSPIAYAMLAVFLAVTGVLFFLSVEQLTLQRPRGIAFPLQLIVNDISFWLVFLFIPPLLTMRLFAEERASGTLEMLLTAPLRDWQIVLSKFVACYGFYVLLWLPTLLYLPVLLDAQIQWDNLNWPTISGLFFQNGLRGVIFLAGLATLAVGVILLLPPFARMLGLMFTLIGLVLTALGVVLLLDGNPEYTLIELGLDPWPVVTSYLGLALVGAMFLAIGMFISSLVKSQMVAALVALFVGLIFIVAGIWRPDLDTSGAVYRSLFYITVPLHFERNFSRGLLDTRQLVLYGSVALLGLFLTIRSLESRRWR